MSKLQGLINQLYPNGVEFKTMGEICDFIRGPFGGSLKKECFVNNGYAVYEQQNAIYNKLEFRYFIDENKYNELKRFIIHSNDLIVSCSGTIGKVMIIPNNAPKGIINQALLKLTPHRNINSKYLKYLFENSIETILNDCSRGGAIKNVPSVSELKKIKIPVPPIEVQTKIANFLSLIDRKIELQEKLVENLNLYKKGLLQKVFSNNHGWKTQKLGDICDTITKGTTPFNFESSGVNFIRVECINNFEIDIKKCLYISNKTHINDLKRSILKENDLLFAIAGSIGKCGIVKKEYLPCNTNQALAIIRLKKNQNPYNI